MAGVESDIAALYDETPAGDPSQSGPTLGRVLFIRLAGLFFAFVQITLASQQRDDLAAFEAAIAELPEVMECYLMSGMSDYLVRVIVEDARDYERIHSNYLTQLPGVDRVHSSFALRTVIKKTEIPIR